MRVDHQSLSGYVYQQGMLESGAYVEVVPLSAQRNCQVGFASRSIHHHHQTERAVCKQMKLATMMEMNGRQQYASESDPAATPSFAPVILE
jgi:hypothetical protein